MNRRTVLFGMAALAFGFAIFSSGQATQNFSLGKGSPSGLDWATILGSVTAGLAALFGGHVQIGGTNMKSVIGLIGDLTKGVNWSRVDLTVIDEHGQAFPFSIPNPKIAPPKPAPIPAPAPLPAPSIPIAP